MKAGKAFTANVVGTSLMTLFSHIVSDLEGQNYSEPNLLSKFLEHSPASLPKNVAKPAGWLGHYLVGAAFTGLYTLWLKQRKSSPSITNGLLLGVLSGVSGIAAWKTAFKLHPNPPKTPTPQFFIQLLAAHVVFGLAVDATLRVLAKPEPEITIPDDSQPDNDPYYPLQDEQAVVSPS